MKINLKKSLEVIKTITNVICAVVITLAFYTLLHAASAYCVLSSLFLIFSSWIILYSNIETTKDDNKNNYTDLKISMLELKNAGLKAQVDACELVEKSKDMVIEDLQEQIKRL